MKLSRKPRQPTALQLAQDTGNPALIDAVEASSKLLHRKALMAAMASAVPVPGFSAWPPKTCSALRSPAVTG